jgi:hypothetical protein
MQARTWLLGATLLLSCSAFAQLRDNDPDWKESEVPPPPPFQIDRALPLDMPRHISVRVAVDPETMRITEDGIVRYVVIASTLAGNINASYEGIRCLTGEVKIYARYSSNGTWRPVPNPAWKPLDDNRPSPHALAFARQGACIGRAAIERSVANIVNRLKMPPPNLQK